MSVTNKQKGNGRDKKAKGWYWQNNNFGRAAAQGAGGGGGGGGASGGEVTGGTKGVWGVLGGGDFGKDFFG